VGVDTIWNVFNGLQNGAGGIDNLVSLQRDLSTLAGETSWSWGLNRIGLVASVISLMLDFMDVKKNLDNLGESLARAR
jgi:hypothetical protein